MPSLQKLAVVLGAALTLTSAVPFDTPSRALALVPRSGSDPGRGGKLVPRPNDPTSGAFGNVQQMLSNVLFAPGELSFQCREESSLTPTLSRCWYRQR